MSGAYKLTSAVTQPSYNGRLGAGNKVEKPSSGNDVFCQAVKFLTYCMYCIFMYSTYFVLHAYVCTYVNMHVVQI